MDGPILTGSEELLETTPKGLAAVGQQCGLVVARLQQDEPLAAEFPCFQRTWFPC